MKRLDTYRARPFIKWVGGKTQLLDDIKKILPRDLSRRDEMTYIEPFVGEEQYCFGFYKNTQT